MRGRYDPQVVLPERAALTLEVGINDGVGVYQGTGVDKHFGEVSEGELHLVEFALSPPVLEGE
ncbi:MAG: hypothetical protein JWO38_3649 [Gemmataceae bacterium]|nr:hypothetical protein [Gemmataceae bacterium]